MNGPLPDETTRTYVSLALFMHLFCVVVVLSGKFYPSSLQSKLAQAVSIYTQTLHLDPGWVPFHLTDAEAGMTASYRWQILQIGADGSQEIVREFPESQQPMKGGFSRLRQEAFARFAVYSTEQVFDDEVCATMVRALAKHYFHTSEQSPQKNETPQDLRLLVRCVEADFVNESEEGSEAVYEADAWLSNDGSVNVLKRMEPRRTAPPVFQPTRSPQQ